MQEVYMVVGGVGEGHGFRSWLVCIYLERAQAELHLSALQRWIIENGQQLEKRCPFDPHKSKDRLQELVYYIQKGQLFVHFDEYQDQMKEG